MRRAGILYHARDALRRLMWGGIVALLNYIPYFGPVIAAFLLALGGLMTFDDCSGSR